MTQSNPPYPPPPPSAPEGLTTTAPAGGLQFDTAEPTAGPAAPPTCVGCNTPILDTYYAAGDKLVCPNCRDQYIASMTGGSGGSRFAKALVFGVVAGAVGAAIWYGVAAATGYTIGLIAIVVGLLVGGAVRAGSEGRGGVLYQILAVLITYVSICATYVPAIMNEGRDQDIPGPILFVISCVLSLAAPFLGGVGIIGLLIIGFALWQAGAMNKKSQATLAGPYSFANPAGGPPLPPPPSAALPASPGPGNP
jgi:hypothetical protein